MKIPQLMPKLGRRGKELLRVLAKHQKNVNDDTVDEDESEGDEEPSSGLEKKKARTSTK
jgi:hypothetical protein